MARARPTALALAVAAAAALAAACNDDGPEPPTSAPPRASTTAASTTSGGSGATTTTGPADATGEPPRLRAVKVADLTGALALAVRTGDDALYVAEQGGMVRAVRNGRVDTTPVLDLAALTRATGEQGLLGLAFSPDGSRLYVDYTDLRGDTRVVEYAFAGGRADPASRRVLLAVDQPFANHNGGHLAFGPDGLLYIGLGDGGSGGDPFGNAQSLKTVLGKILRIDPRPDGDQPYTVPPDNPFVGRPGARPEIWAYGLRNPWRFSFDRATGAMWIGDVGQNSREEVDTSGPGSTGGENYGWDHFEGTSRFSAGSPDDYVAPVFDYPTGDGNCSVTGGYVYRGSRMTALRGRYVFGDFCKGEVLALVPGDDGPRSVGLGPRVDGLSSFGEDAAGELYALSLGDGLLRLEPAG